LDDKVEKSKKDLDEKMEGISKDLEDAKQMIDLLQQASEPGYIAAMRQHQQSKFANDGGHAQGDQLFTQVAPTGNVLSSL
jgi:hypothetical protein